MTHAYHSTSRTASLLLRVLVLLTLSTGHALADDEQVWAALKQGGKVILLRHTHVDIQEGIGHLAPGNCAQEVNLSSRGVEQAKRIGAAFRTHGIAVGEVLTSPIAAASTPARLRLAARRPFSISGHRVPYLKTRPNWIGHVLCKKF
jgi:hypothetical protein